MDGQRDDFLQSVLFRPLSWGFRSLEIRCTLSVDFYETWVEEGNLKYVQAFGDIPAFKRIASFQALHDNNPDLEYIQNDFVVGGTLSKQKEWLKMISTGISSEPETGRDYDIGEWELESEPCLKDLVWHSNREQSIVRSAIPIASCRVVETGLQWIGREKFDSLLDFQRKNACL